MPALALRSRLRTSAPRWAMPRLRIRPKVLLVLLLVLAVLGCAWLLVRDSSLVAVRKVTVIGASGTQAAKIRAALKAAALDMTTLHVREDELLSTAQAFPGVRSISVQTHFPHGLTIEVRQIVPVAVLVAAGGRRTPVSGDGTLLPDAVTGPLATIRTSASTAGGRLTDRAADAELSILSVVPPELRSRVARAWRSPTQGYVVQFRRGPVAWFGGPGAAADKWAAVARVLTFPNVAGASYIDVTVPTHPVVGGLSGGPAPQSDVPDATRDAPPAPAGGGPDSTDATPVG